VHQPVGVGKGGSRKTRREEDLTHPRRNQRAKKRRSTVISSVPRHAWGKGLIEGKEDPLLRLRTRSRRTGVAKKMEKESKGGITVKRF